MSYTGDVVVGGEPDVRILPALVITKVATPPFQNNCYLLRCTSTGETLLVDAAGDAPRLLELVGDGTLTTVVETHGHWDHVGALADVVAATDAKVLAHPGDAGDLPVPVDRLVSDGDTIDVGTCTLTVLHIDGHTPGSIALLYDADPSAPHLFSGDSLFPGGAGRTTEPQHFTSLMDDLERKVFGVLPDNTWIYPGHGKDTTLGTERPSLQEWRERGW